MSSNQALNQFAPWSISKSDLAAKCPYAFYLRYVSRLPRTAGTASKIGTAAHRVQELLLQHKAPREALDEALTEAEDLTHAEIESVEGLLGKMTDFYARIQRFKERTNIVEEFYEQNWAINSKFEAVPDDAPDIFFRGVVDYAMLTAGGYLIVIDHKSGRRHPVEKYAKQLDAYAVLGLAAHPKIHGVHAALHYIATGDIDWHHMRKTPQITKVLRPHMSEYLRTRAAGLQEFAPRVNNLCGWCDYLEHCADGKAAVAAKKEERRLATNKKARDRRASKKRELTVVYEDSDE